MKGNKLIVTRIAFILLMGTIAISFIVKRATVASANPTVLGEQIIHVTAKKFTYSPSQIVLKKGEAVVLELTSQDREHGFRMEELGIRADVKPGETTRVRLVPQQTGTFSFACDVFCGTGHEEMAGEIVVVD